MSVDKFNLTFTSSPSNFAGTIISPSPSSKIMNQTIQIADSAITSFDKRGPIKEKTAFGAFKINGSDMGMGSRSSFAQILMSEN